MTLKNYKKISPLICLCNKVPLADIESAIARGCDTLSKIAMATTAGAGQCGGSCQPAIQKILKSHEQNGALHNKKVPGTFYVVATPIGNLGDITLRAIEILKLCPVIIGEEFRPTSTLLKRLNIEQKDKQIYLLNEHSTKKDIDELAEICGKQNVALISDCGTPVFSDPGADLIRACRKNGVPITSLPGASSLTTLISLSSQKLQQFVFFGFLPANKEERANKLKNIKSESRSWIIMDTPYRLKSTLDELAREMPNQRALLAVNLTQDSEEILEGTFKELTSKCKLDEGEFMILKY